MVELKTYGKKLKLKPSKPIIILIGFVFVIVILLIVNRISRDMGDKNLEEVVQTEVIPMESSANTYEQLTGTIINIVTIIVIVSIITTVITAFGRMRWE